MFNNQAKKIIKISCGAGFGLLEIVLAITVISGSLFAIAGASRLAFIVSSENLLKSQAGFLLEEGAEALKTIRDRSWNDFSSIPNNTLYYLVFSGGAWQATNIDPGPVAGVFTRTVTVSNVLRDAGDNIAGSGVPDPDTRKIVVKVSWQERSLGVSQEAISYISRINEN